MGNIFSCNSNKSYYLPIGENNNCCSISEGLDYPPYFEEKKIFNFEHLPKYNKKTVC